MKLKRSAFILLAFLAVGMIAVSTSISLAQSSPEAKQQADLKNAPKQPAPPPKTDATNSSRTGKARGSSDNLNPPKSITK
jgi:hypothetical protein